MKKIILFICLVSTVLFLSANENKSNVQIENSKISIENTDNNEATEDAYIESIIINIPECTVTLTGRIGYNNTFVEVQFSNTAETCEEALMEVLETFKKAREMLREM